MKYNIQVEEVYEGTIDLGKAGITLEQFQELSWEEQYDIVREYADTYRVDTSDWHIQQPSQKEDE